MLRNITFLILISISIASPAQDLNQLYEHAFTTQSIEEAEKVKEIALKENNFEVAASCYYLIGYLNKREEKFYEAVTNYFHAIKIWRELNDHHSDLANTLINVGNIYRNSGFKSTALKYLGDALALQQKLSDSTGIVYSMHNIGNIYYDLQELDSAIIYYYKAVKVASRIGLLEKAAHSYNAIGTTYEKQHNYQEARKHYDLALEANNSIAMQAIIFNNKGYTYLLEENHPIANQYFQKALKLNKNEIDQRTLSLLYGNLALNSVKNNPDSALYFYEQSFSYLKDKMVTLGDEYLETCYKLQILHKQENNIEKADYYAQLQYEFAHNMMKLQDELKTLSIQYQVEAATWKTKSDHQAAELKDQNKILQAIILLLVLLFTALVIYFCLYYKSRKKTAFMLDTVQKAYEPLSSYLREQEAHRAVGSG